MNNRSSATWINHHYYTCITNHQWNQCHHELSAVTGRFLSRLFLVASSAADPVTLRSPGACCGMLRQRPGPSGPSAPGAFRVVPLLWWHPGRGFGRRDAHTALQAGQGGPGSLGASGWLELRSQGYPVLALYGGGQELPGLCNFFLVVTFIRAN